MLAAEMAEQDAATVSRARNAERGARANALRAEPSGRIAATCITGVAEQAVQCPCSQRRCCIPTARASQCTMAASSGSAAG